MVTPQGYALQQAGGGDLVLDGPAVKILADGTVLDGERPVGRIGLFARPRARRSSRWTARCSASAAALQEMPSRSFVRV